METVAVVGLGYVGLPLVVAFGQGRRTIGFDVLPDKVMSCQAGQDPSRELSDEEMASAGLAEYTSDPAMLAEADFIIIAVPTPVDAARIPDLNPLLLASRTVGRHMKPGCVVIYESTVYPGATEEVCIPELEKTSGLSWLQDFHVGYSPERINPGDKDHRLHNVIKVVSGDDGATLDRVAALYESIVEPGVHRCSSIKTAEACKVIENTQRDLNIAFMNELSIIFGRIGIDTAEVLRAAGTKWNFLRFSPGLVGGHCIGVDPYYLTHKAEMLGYHPQIILAGRRINDGMGKYIVEQSVKRLIAAGFPVKGARALVLGATFKENCSDIRNSKVFDIVSELESYGVDVKVVDPLADPHEVAREYGVETCRWSDVPQVQLLVAAVAHREFLSMGAADFSQKLVHGGVFVDVKSVFDPATLADAGFSVWRL